MVFSVRYLDSLGNSRSAKIIASDGDAAKEIAEYDAAEDETVISVAEDTKLPNRHRKITLAWYGKENQDF